MARQQNVSGIPPDLSAETGQSGNAIWEAYGVDFVKEGGEWKIWHLHMFTDFTGSFFVDLSKSGNSGGGPGRGEAAPEGESPEGESPEGESPENAVPADAAQGEPADNGNLGWQPEGGETIAMETVNEYLSDPTYTIFSPKRLLSEMMIYIPVPYESWSFDDPNYGLSVDQYALYNIDLDAWYAVH